MRQRVTSALTIAAVVAVGLTWQAMRVGAQSGVLPICGTDMRVLVIANGTEVELSAVTAALDYPGIPYTVYTVSSHPAGALVPDVLATGCHALYNGVILTVSNGTGLTPTELATLTAFEAANHVRQVTWYSWPSADLGFVTANPGGTGATINATLTAAGAQVFPYLNNTANASAISIQNSWTYLAATSPGDPTTTALLTDAAGNTLAAIHTSEGRENLAMTFDSNPYMLHDMLLSYGVVNWVTNGLFIGDRHVYMSPQVDDVFIDDAQWLAATTTCGTNVDSTGATQRIVGNDLNAVNTWQSSKRLQALTANLRITMAFNGVGTTSAYTQVTVGGADQVIGGATTGRTADTLTPAARALQGNFYWVSHTYDHENLDSATPEIPYALEITQNHTAATALGLTDNYSRIFLVQPDVSGLGNPVFLQAAWDNGLRYLLSNTSVTGQDNPAPNIGFWTTSQPGIFVIPRRANNLFFNVATPADWAAEYNCIYAPGGSAPYWNHPLTAPEIIDFETQALLADMLRGELDPWMFHQTNLAAYDGMHTLITDLLDAALTKYSGYFNLPVVSPPIDKLGSLMANRTVARTAGISATIQPGVGIVVSSPVNVTIPITGLRLPGAEFYGGQWISWVPLTANVPVVLPLGSTQVQPPTVKGTVFSDGVGRRVTPAFNVAAGDVLVAFAGSDGPVPGTQTVTMSAAGLVWTMVKRVNAQAGTSEVWTATATGPLTGVTVASTQAAANFYQSLTVVTFAGAGGVGASATANAVSGGPTVSLTTTKDGSLVYGVGNDWDQAIARTVGAGQALAHQYLAPAGDTFWVQNLTSAVATNGTPARLFDTAPTADRWNFAAVEIVPAVLTVPGVVLTVPVPDVANMLQADAVAAINTNGLVTATGSASSLTVPTGRVISQNPLAGTQALTGSTVSILVSSGPPPASPIVDATVFSDGLGARTVTLSTSGPDTVLLAFVASDGPSGQTQTSTMSGSGLTWTLVKRVNAQRGASEIFAATATNQLLNASITSTPSRIAFQQSLTVVAFTGSSGVGASAVASAATGAPTVTLATTRANSLVFGVGNDWDTAIARTVGLDQALVHQVLASDGDTFWVQNRISPVTAIGPVSLNDTAPTTDRWNFAAVEIKAR